MQSHTVVVVAFDRISPFHLAVPCLIFGESAPVAPAFEQIVCAIEPGLLNTAAGFEIIVSHGLEALDIAQTIVVPDWQDPFERPPQPLLDALMAAHGRGAQLIGLRLGTFVLAETGLLEGRKATTHWAWAQDFAQRYPGTHLDADALYIEDGNILTSAGAAAGIDCCLDRIRQQFGTEAATRVGQFLVMPPHRQGGQAQFIERPLPATARDMRLGNLLDWMRAHLQMPHSLDGLAKTSRMSKRSFTRHFRQRTGTTVGEWLLNERLALSQRLLETTGQSIESIADIAGFGSAVMLRRHFGKAFRTSPTLWRQTHQEGGKLRQLQADLRFFECLDRVNQAIQGTNDLERMMYDVLDVVLSIFDSDRAFLMYPCDPTAAHWRISMERTRPAYPGAFDLGLDVPMDNAVAEKIRVLLDTDGPVPFGPGTGRPVSPVVTDRFAVKSAVLMAMYPKEDKPWIFGLHQCSHARVWTPDEARLLQEIGWRLTDGLTMLLAYRGLRQSERKRQLALSVGQIGVFEVNVQSGRGTVTPKFAEIWGMAAEFSGNLVSFWWDHVHPEDLARTQETFIRTIEGHREGEMEFRIIRPDGKLRWLQWRGQVCPDDGGRIVGVVMDVSERLRADPTRPAREQL